MRNYYEVLGVKPDATPAEIKKAYISLAKKYHPDTTIFDRTAAAEIMKEGNAAYETLRDPQERADYDRTIGISPNSGHSKDSQTAEVEEYVVFMSLVNSIDDICLNVVKKAKGMNKRTDVRIIDALLNEFQSKVAINVKNVVESPFMQNGILEGVGVVYYILGAHYFSSGYFVKAKIMNDFALVFLSKNGSIYADAQTAKHNIDFAISNPPKSRSPQELFRNIVVGAIILFVIYSIFSTSSNSNQHNTKVATNTSQSSKINNAKKSVNNKAEPIPKKGVMTGYVNGVPVLNNTGLCEFTIDNTQNSEPVYVRLWKLGDTPKPIRTINIAPHDSFTMKTLNPGTYEIRYKYLYENVEAESGSKSESFTLQQIKEFDDTKYSAVRLTLYKVRNGNSRTYPISGSDV